jgi:NhaA family Na+:H+ antiporter
LPIFFWRFGHSCSRRIFLLLNIGTITQNGAGIPMATDIAFAIDFISFGIEFLLRSKYFDRA